MIPLRYIWRSLGRRKLRTVMTIMGVALVVAIYAAMSAVAQTMVETFKSTGTPEEVVAIQAGALTADFSRVNRDSLTFVQTLDGVASAGERSEASRSERPTFSVRSASSGGAGRGPDAGSPSVASQCSSTGSTSVARWSSKENAGPS